MDPKFDELKSHLHEITDLRMAASVLSWDQETMMPRKGGEARAWQLSTLQGIYHERLTDPKVGEILDGLASATGSERGDVARALIRELRRDYDRAVKLPNRLVRQLAEATSRGVEVWREARERSDFSLFADDLRAIVDLKRQVADHVGYEGSPYNALLDEFEPGPTAEQTFEVMSFAGSSGSFATVNLPMLGGSRLAQESPRASVSTAETSSFMSEKNRRQLSSTERGSSRNLV